VSGQAGVGVCLVDRVIADLLGLGVRNLVPYLPALEMKFSRAALASASCSSSAPGRTASAIPTGPLAGSVESSG
jgi:hypothetical protein